MADVQPTADPNTVTQKNHTSESDEKTTPNRKKSSVATANVKRKPSFVEKVRRSTTLENISNNIGSQKKGKNAWEEMYVLVVHYGDIGAEKIDDIGGKESGSISTTDGTTTGGSPRSGAEKSYFFAWMDQI